MAKKNSNVSSDSVQAGSATRGNEAGSSSEVVTSGAGSGVASSGSESQYGLSGAETISDIGQAEAFTRSNTRGAQIGSQLDAYLSGHLARMTHLGELIANNSALHANNMNSLNQHLRELSLKNDDTTDTINVAHLTNALAAMGLKLSAVALDGDE